MKKFQKTVNIRMSVDVIAETLLEKIDTKFENREKIVECVITTLLQEEDALSYLYNTLTNNMTFSNSQIGDKMFCHHEVWMHKTEESKTTGKATKSIIGECIVIDENPYQEANLLVSYDYYTHSGNIREETQWVSSEMCSKSEISVNL